MSLKERFRLEDLENEEMNLKRIYPVKDKEEATISSSQILATPSEDS